MNESSRIKRFRLGLAKEIPKFPNNGESHDGLRAKSLGALLIDYANWKVRYITPRPRRIVVEPAAVGDPRWTSQAPQIQALLRRVEQGEDLTPFLSLRAHRLGFTPNASLAHPSADRWADKDMLLNVLGYHHLHFDAAPSDQMRSDDVLFAHVTRDTFTVSGIFDHTVFAKTPPDAPMTAERHRLWEIFDNHCARDVPPGSVMLQSIIATSGHALHTVYRAMNYARMVTSIDPRLDDPSYVAGLYEQAKLSAPRKLRLKWHMYFLDIGLFDKEIGAFLSFQKGPN
jgi:hypothetical protein